jgi:hypothetical protein
VAEDVSYLATRLETENANIILLSEKKSRLGTLAVAMPQKGKKLGPPLSSILLGGRNMTVSRLLAESIAEKTGKTVLLSTFIKSLSEREVGPILLKLVEKTFRKASIE